MRRSRYMALGTIGIAAALALAGCSTQGTSGASSGSHSGKTAHAVSLNGKGKTITVWAMVGDLTTDNLNAINSKFTKETGAKVKVDTQQWPNIATKITTALATSTPPDVIDIGNTQVATFASSGGLADLTKDKTSLEQGQTWLGGLVDPATIDGHLYAVPSFGAARAAIYNTTIWKDAGITQAPTSYSQLETDLNAIKKKNAAKKNFAAFYLPGQYWYAGMQWVWDAGGQIAAKSGGSWKADFASPQSEKGLQEWKTFENTYSTPASRTLNTDKPDQDQVFADGDAATIIANSTDIATIQKDNPKLTTADIGTFPMPGISGKNQPALLAGSDWGIAQKSPNKALALAWVKIAASPAMQKGQTAKTWIPNSVQASKAVVASGAVPAIDKAFYTAAQISDATPAAAGWAPLEQPGMLQFFQSVATGSKTIPQAAASWDATVAKALNAQG